MISSWFAMNYLLLIIFLIVGSGAVSLWLGGKAIGINKIKPFEAFVIVFIGMVAGIIFLFLIPKIGWLIGFLFYVSLIKFSTEAGWKKSFLAGIISVGVGTVIGATMIFLLTSSFSAFK